MLLNKFNKDKALLKVKNNRSKNIKIASIVLSIILLTGAIIYFSFARFEANSDILHLINGKVGLFQKWVDVDYYGDNLLYNLEDVKDVTSNKMTYSVYDGTVTVTANENDGYGNTNGRIILDTNKTYVFNCDTNGTWGSGTTSNVTDTVEAYLAYEGKSTTGNTIRMKDSNNFEFTASKSGTYYLRLDVNTNGKTYKFNNISIREKIDSKTYRNNRAIENLSTLSSSGSTFVGWYSDYKESNRVDSSTIVTPSLTKLFARSIDNTSLTAKILNDNNVNDDIYSKKPTLSKVAVSQEYYDTLPATCEGNGCIKKSAAIVENGIYTNEDDYGTTYYFRGHIENNYILFGGYCWRIVRINGNDTIKLLYQGETCDSNTGSYESIYNDHQAKPAIIGYMYGDIDGSTYDEMFEIVNESEIKKTVDQWYNDKISTYNSYLSDTLFCNDKSYFYINGFDKAENSINQKNASFKCQLKDDRYTVDDTIIGNGALSYPIALITADELVFAGAKAGSSEKTTRNTNYYAYNGLSNWTMTPCAAGYTSSSVRIWNSGAYVHMDALNGPRYARPAINLRANVKYSSGTGTATDPYTIN